MRNDGTDGQEYLTPQQAAALLQVPVSWVYARTRAGTFPGQRKIGKYVRIFKAELLQWVESQHSTVSGSGGYREGLHAPPSFSAPARWRKV